MPDFSQFFHALFEDLQGYLCLARIHRLNGLGFSQAFFKYPQELDKALAYIEEFNTYGMDLYLCPHLLSKPERKKENALPSLVLWADADTCQPENFGKFGEPKPSIIVETSPGRWQVYWRMRSPLNLKKVEELNKRIAVAYKEYGCDQGGWDTTQLLRIPTKNWKYVSR